MKFRKKPVVVEAMLFNQNTKKEVLDFLYDKGSKLFNGFLDGENLDYLKIPTLEGEMIAQYGDWIIKEPFPTNDRIFYPCKPDVFEATYEPVTPPNHKEKER